LSSLRDEDENARCCARRAGLDSLTTVFFILFVLVTMQAVEPVEE
jgi:hypothetical protein